MHIIRDRLGRIRRYARVTYALLLGSVTLVTAVGFWQNRLQDRAWVRRDDLRACGPECGFVPAGGNVVSVRTVTRRELRLSAALQAGIRAGATQRGPPMRGIMDERGN